MTLNMQTPCQFGAFRWFHGTVPRVPTSTKEQIILAAEQLFAEHGLDAVSLRQVGTAAGCGNHSAAQHPAKPSSRSWRGSPRLASGRFRGRARKLDASRSATA